MRKYFKITSVLLFLVFLCSISFASIQGYERDNELSNSANRMFRNLHQRTMPFLSEVLSTSQRPTTDELPQGWAAVSRDTSVASATYALFFNIEGTVVKVDLQIA